MKTINLLLISLLIPFTGIANNEKKVESNVKNVTVFLNSAQVTRTANVNIEAGVNDLIFEGVSPYLNTKSIQARGTGKYIILDVQYRIKYPEPQATIVSTLPQQILRGIKLLEDSLSDLSFDIENIYNKKEVLNLEKNVLLQNKFMQGNVDTIPELKDAMEYLRKQLNDINLELNKLNRQNYNLTKLQSRQQERLNELKAYNSHINPPKQESPKYQIVVTVSSDYPAQGKITLEYMVNNAGWSPEYDIRAEGTDKPINLVYKANVYQNSGEDWDNVNLKLSTITPNLSNNKPILPIQYLSYYYNNVVELCSKNRESKKDMNEAVAYGGASMQDEDIQLDYSKIPASNSAQYTQVQQTMTNVEFDIKLAYSIPSDGQYHKVAIQNYELKTEYYHYLVPRIDKQAYLIARIADWGNLDLLTANANIYFEGTYVGETTINPSIMQDTLELSLGKDRGIIVERKKNLDEQRNVLIGSNVIKSISYEIIIKNNKLFASNLIIEDQLPISQQTDIKIQTIELSNAKHNETTGMLKWNLKLNSKESKTIKFSYEIEHNKDKQLANLF
ncbi:MAG TPA: hypothetical protein DDX39_01570 [Bacteroidales bacterium]|nr:MAG: hypothetical protein A2W98_07785 [Bacteroidetes bacterium GWF2_33_38]HBF87300.1 hypothetical protein [Bacteroidales bacterium]